MAIQEALADAGVNVSKSTVQREVARLARKALPRAVTPGVTVPAQQAHGPGPPATSTSIAHHLADKPHSGKDIAEAFMKGRITNPLFRTRS